jgi:hypothetical protein
MRINTSQHAAQCPKCKQPVFHTGFKEYGKNKKTGSYIKRFELYYCYYCKKHFRIQKQNPVDRQFKGNKQGDNTKIVILIAISKLQNTLTNDYNGSKGVLVKDIIMFLNKRGHKIDSNIRNQNNRKWNRYTIERNCGELIEEGLLQRESKRSGYRLSEEGMKDPILYRRIFRALPIDRIWKVKIKGKPFLDLLKDYHSTPNLSQLTEKEKQIHWDSILNKSTQIVHNKFFNYNINEKNSLKQEPFEPIEKYNQYLDERELALFANKIGAVITKILIITLHPYDSSHMDPAFDNWLKTQVGGREKDQNAMKFVVKLIDPVKILNEFCKLSCIKNGLPVWTNKMKYTEDDRDTEIRTIQHSNLPDSVKERDIEFCHRHFRIAEDVNSKLRMANPQDPRWSPYELDNDNFERITKIYSSVFPSLSKEILNLGNT